MANETAPQPKIVITKINNFFFRTSLPFYEKRPPLGGTKYAA
jgi:hypothetical protein